MRSLFKFLAAGTVVSLLAFAMVSFSAGTSQVPVASAAQADYYLKIEGIDGEVSIASFSWGVTAPRDLQSGQSTGKRQYQPIIIRKSIDKTSPLLFRVANEGKRLKKVTLIKQSGGGAPEYNVVFEDVMISSFMHEGSTDNAPVESISMSYQKITY